MGTLSRRERGLVGGAVLLAFIVGSWILLIEPVRERNRVAQEILPAREEMLARRRELVGRRDTIGTDLETLNAKLAGMAGRFLPAATPAVAASELQKLAKDTAAQAGTEIRSERILPPLERGEILEIPIEIAVSGEIRQLVDLLSRLEAAPKLLTVSDVKVRVVNVSQPKDLLVTMTLSGYILTGGART